MIIWSCVCERATVYVNFFGMHFETNWTIKIAMAMCCFYASIFFLSLALSLIGKTNRMPQCMGATKRWNFGPNKIYSRTIYAKFIFFSYCRVLIFLRSKLWFLKKAIMRFLLLQHVLPCGFNECIVSFTDSQNQFCYKIKWIEQILSMKNRRLLRAVFKTHTHAPIITFKVRQNSIQ